MTFVQLPDGITYTSWIKLEEQAEEIILKLYELNKLIHIDSPENISVNNALIFDVGEFLEGGVE